ncbi:MAG: ferredoxin--NADP reductase [Sphingobacteriaceae bacterium]|nr:MAG: ferredoxin--NADP reductase [Sphingobacteriaceae bacterium]
MLSFTLQVVEIRPETPDTVTICLKQPGLKKIKYLPGQYLTLIFRINGRKYIRPYSFSSAPGVDAHLEVTVKRVPGGIVSNHIIDFVKAGDQLEVAPPLGDFVFDATKIDSKKHIILWGAGSGITPLISIAKYILYQHTGHKVRLVYGNRSAETVIFKDRITELEQLFPEDLKTWHFHTQPQIADNNPAVIEGRISPDKVLSVLKEETDLQNTLHFICGPTGLKESVKQKLQQLSVSSEAIYTEDFEIVKNPADFEDIVTRFVEVIKEGQTHKVEVTKGKSMLEAGLDALLELDYSCQTGSCTLCKAKVLSGGIKNIGLDVLPDSLNPDECLLCCGYPLTDDVQVSVYY